MLHIYNRMLVFKFDNDFPIFVNFQPAMQVFAYLSDFCPFG